MSDDKSKTRRKVLESIGAGAITSALYSSSAIASNNDRERPAGQARGEFFDPVDKEDINKARESAFEAHRDNLKSAEYSVTAQTNDQGFVLTRPWEDGQAHILAYNIVLNENGVPTEQIFSTKQPKSVDSYRPKATNFEADPERISERFNRLADIELGRKMSMTDSTINQDSVSQDNIDPGDCEFGDDYCLDEMDLVGSTEVWRDYELDTQVTGEADYAGEVRYTNNIYYDNDAKRAVSNTHVLLQAGHYLCNIEGLDEFCRSSGAYGSGWSNSELQVEHDWQKSGNSESDADDIIDDLSPFHDIDDQSVTEETSVTVGANIDDEGVGISGSVGWSRTVELPDAEMRNVTDMRRQNVVRHKMEMPYDTVAAEEIAMGDSAGLVLFEPWCEDGQFEGSEKVCDLDYEVEYERSALIGSMTEQYDESFSYYYMCSCVGVCPVA